MAQTPGMLSPRVDFYKKSGFAFHLAESGSHPRWERVCYCSLSNPRGSALEFESSFVCSHGQGGSVAAG